MEYGEKKPEYDQSKLEYIKIEWADIHHNRLQEWTVLGVNAGIFYVMFQEKVPDEARLFLSLFGVLSSFLGACICWQHYKIFIRKIALIDKEEKELGIEYPKRESLFSAQIFIFLLLASINSAFVGMAAYYFFDKTCTEFTYLVGLETFLSFLVFALIRRSKRFSENEEPEVLRSSILGLLIIVGVLVKCLLNPPEIKSLKQLYYIPVLIPLLPFIVSLGTKIKNFFLNRKSKLNLFQDPDNRTISIQINEDQRNKLEERVNILRNLILTRKEAAPITEEKVDNLGKKAEYTEKVDYLVEVANDLAEEIERFLKGINENQDDKNNQQ